MCLLKENVIRKPNLWQSMKNTGLISLKRLLSIGNRTSWISLLDKPTVPAFKELANISVDPQEEMEEGQACVFLGLW